MYEQELAAQHANLTRYLCNTIHNVKVVISSRSADDLLVWAQLTAAVHALGPALQASFDFNKH